MWWKTLLACFKMYLLILIPTVCNADACDLSVSLPGFVHQRLVQVFHCFSILSIFIFSVFVFPLGMQSSLSPESVDGSKLSFITAL